MYILSVHLGVLPPPPPNTKKLATLVTTHTFPLGAPHWCTGGGGGLGGASLQNKIQFHTSLLIISTCRQVEISFLGMPQIAHFKSKNEKAPYRGRAGARGHPPPTPSPCSVATLPRKDCAPKCFGSLRHCCPPPPPQCVDPRYATVQGDRIWGLSVARIFSSASAFQRFSRILLSHFFFWPENSLLKNSGGAGLMASDDRLSYPRRI